MKKLFFCALLLCSTALIGADKEKKINVAKSKSQAEKTENSEDIKKKLAQLEEEGNALKEQIKILSTAFKASFSISTLNKINELQAKLDQNTQDNIKEVNALKLLTQAKTVSQQ